MEPTEQRARIRNATLSLGLFLSAGLANPVVAGEGAYFAEIDGPVIVDRGASLPSSLTASRRPVPFSEARGSSFAQIANIRVEVAASDSCGTRSTQRLVLCLDTDGRFPPADELALLARLPRATAVEAGSVQASQALIAAAALADVRSPVEPVITSFADCTGACGGRVVVESTP